MSVIRRAHDRDQAVPSRDDARVVAFLDQQADDSVYRPGP